MFALRKLIALYYPFQFKPIKSKFYSFYQAIQKQFFVIIANAFIFDVSTDLSGSFIGAVSFENVCIAKINCIILSILIQANQSKFYSFKFKQIKKQILFIQIKQIIKSNYLYFSQCIYFRCE